MVKSFGDKGFQFGIGLGLMTGVFPLFAGLFSFYQTVLRGFPGAVTSPEDWDFYLMAHVGSANLSMTGIFVCVISYFGLVEKRKWAWWALLTAIIWSGGNDSIALFRYMNAVGQGFPLALVPVTTGFLALALTRKKIFSIKN